MVKMDDEFTFYRCDSCIVLQVLREFYGLIAMNAILVVLDWRRALLFVLVPHNVAQWGIVTMNLIPHDDCGIIVTPPYHG